MIMASLALAGYTERAAAQNSVKTGTPAKPAKPAKKRSVERPTPTAEAPVWPVDSPAPLSGAILPAKRIVAFYGNPISKRMGILGELPPEEMLAKLDREVAAWNKADPSTPVQPALHMIVDVASATPGTSGKYRTRMDSAMIEQVYGWAQKRNALLFLDLQVGQGTVQEELPRLAKFLKRPDVHLGIDPEFSMKHKEVPGTVIGTLDAADVNYASGFLQALVDSEHLPPKILVIHRFRRAMLTNYKKIKLDPRVQIVINMDGWGPQSQKLDSYRAYVWKYPVEYTGFKLFYKNDKRKKGSAMMTPAEVLALDPRPFYIQYQ
ncbi:MAG: hypothetical protein JWM41_3859 [Gemmatimonadetes bacterium]|nr:hypothetical protein [Gemmatimonadota bacterium]